MGLFVFDNKNNVFNECNFLKVFLVYFSFIFKYGWMFKIENSLFF